MLYKKRVERALDHLAAKRGRKRKDPDRDKYAPLPGQEYDPRAEQEPDDISHMLERGDLAAMLISAFLVLLPVCLVVLLVLAGVGALFLSAFDARTKKTRLGRRVFFCAFFGKAQQ